MGYTYRELLEALQQLSEDELALNVTLYDYQGENYYPLNYCGKTEGDDVLDSEHPILIFNDPEDDDNEGTGEQDGTS